MSLETRDEKRMIPRGWNPSAAERPCAHGKRPESRARPQASLLVQVFGGTILSIIALAVFTAYGQLTTMVTDLRRDVNGVQVEYQKKDEFSMRLMAMWNAIKELQTAGAAVPRLDEHAKALDKHLACQGQDLQRRVEELNKRLGELSERLAALEAAQRVITRQ
jgi:hypothetical protein